MEPVPFLIQLVVAAFISTSPQPAANPAPPVPPTFASAPVPTLDDAAAEQLALRQAAAANRAHTTTTAPAATPSTNPSTAPVGDGKTPPPDSAAAKEHLHLPLDPGSYVFTSDYGPRCIPIGGVPLFHDGIDLAAPLGTPIYAIADGTVVKVVDGVNDVNTNGGELAVQATINGQTITYVYRHMLNTSQYVKVGDTVKAGQHVSDVASTGHSTGPHLHFEIHQGILTDKTIDPEAWTNSIGLPVVGNASANYASHHQDMAQCPSDETPPADATPSAPSVVVAGGKETPTPAQPVTPTQKPSTPAPAPVTPQPAPPTVTTKPTTPSSPTASPVTTPSTAPSPATVTVPLPSATVAVP